MFDAPIIFLYNILGLINPESFGNNCHTISDQIRTRIKYFCILTANSFPFQEYWTRSTWNRPSRIRLMIEWEISFSEFPARIKGEFLKLWAGDRISAWWGSWSLSWTILKLCCVVKRLCSPLRFEALGGSIKKIGQT